MSTHKYTVWNLDVLGNPADGFEVNNRSRCGTIELDPNASNTTILMALYKAEFLSAKGLACAGISDDSDASCMYIQDDKEGRPLYQLEEQS